MIPRADVPIRHDPVPFRATFPSEEALRGGYLDGNREYDVSLLDATWEDARAALEVERGRLEQAADLADDVNEFEDFLDGDLEDWEAMAVDGLDVGVAALVLALSAAGCVTTTSCRGHPGYASPGRDYPRVRFYADPCRASLVRQLAIAADCGFGADQEGPFEVWAASIQGTIELAGAVTDAGDDFDRMHRRGAL